MVGRDDLFRALLLLGTLSLLMAADRPHAAGQKGSAPQRKAHLGFDRNVYPGDANLAALRRSFSFTGYWLNAPPGETTNTWAGNREIVRKLGFGFLVLFNGRLDRELKKAANASELGRSDAAKAVQSAHTEGFPPGTVIFLDQEEGGRMLPEQKAYIYSWVDDVTRGGFRAGIYCSGIPAKVEGGDSVTTADDIRRDAGAREIVFWVVNDACPPSPGCALPQNVPLPSSSGTKFADVWQFAQSPKRSEFALHCSNYASDGNCYPPGLRKEKLFVDLNSANSEDPSGGR